MLKRKWIKGIILTLTFALLSTGISYADPGDDDDDHPHDVSVNNWQTFRPRVTALRSLNAYLATDKNQQVYYVPILEELPGVENAVSDCTDYAGKRQQFAAIYKGYFNQMCYEALVRKSDGTYSKVPAIVSSEGKNSVRELTTLGYDFLLTSEAISNIRIDGESIDADYKVGKIDALNGYVDLNTALMDIYKAVGQEKYDITYAFSADENMTVENSPIQGEINVTLSQTNTLDTSAGRGWVFATRTNPMLYWKQAAYDGVVFDTDALGYSKGQNEQSSGNKTQEVTLAEFCAYAYNIMNIYGEPVMTQSEKNILLQLYGSVVPYKACEDAQVEAIETFIAKGIISPDDDQTYLNWNGSLKYDYMLTLLMRIKDVNARKTYKDVQITMDASMISNDYYNANLTFEQSNIMGFESAISAARVTNYYDYFLGADVFRRMAKTLKTREGLDLDFFIPAHLAVEGVDGTLFPISTQVTPYSLQVYSTNYPDVDYVLNQSTYSAETDGPLMTFCISNGIKDGNLHLRLTTFNIPNLIQSDGMYHLYLVDEEGNKSVDGFSIKPGGGIYYASGVRHGDDGEDMITDRTEDVEYDNEEEVQEVIDVYESKGKQAAQQLARSLINKHPEWTLDEIKAIEFAASDGEMLSADSVYTYYMKIVAGSEGTIEVTSNNGDIVKLSDIMANQELHGLHYVNPNDTSDLGFRKINPSLYQVENCANKNDLSQRIKGVLQENFASAYCKKDEELMVSTRWLKESGFIAVNPSVSGDLLMLSTSYSNIYLDRGNHFIVVGSTVYSVADKDESEIWKEMGDGDIYINFRAVLGWTGDFMIFKNVGNSISVTVLRANSVGSRSNTINGAGAQAYSIPIKMADVGIGNTLNMPETAGNTVFVQGYDDTKSNNRKDVVPMWAMYPLGNYFVYMNSHMIDNAADATYHDWLFVFKPKSIQVNGRLVTYDDNPSRELLHQVMNVDVSKLDKNITVWAYPLYRDNSSNKGMPKGMEYTDQYGYIYTPQTPNSLQDALVSYVNPDNVRKSTGAPEYVLPFYIDKTGDIRCINFNSFKYENGTRQLDYGQLPAVYIAPPEWLARPINTWLPLISNVLYVPWSQATGLPGFTPAGSVNYADTEVIPTITSPALWFLELNQFSCEEVIASMGEGSQLYWGTMKVRLTKDTQTGKDCLMVGSKDLTDMLRDQKFLLMRETATNTSRVGRWFSVSALTAFDLEPIIDSGSGTTAEIDVPADSLLGTTVDVIDWDEFKMTRILETCEFGIAILMIITLNFIPRVALFCFLLLIALSTIRNVKLVQVFCDRLFDPYKFLTSGRRDVHTFNSRRVFMSSIVAMAVFSLFMDGSIIHIYEWFMRLLAILVGLR